MTDLTDLAAAADALCSPIRVREPIWERRNGHLKLVRVWDHQLPSLLEQLRAAIHPGEAYTEPDTGGGHHEPRSAPAARIDAVDALLRIEAAAAAWANRLGLPVRETAAGNIWAIVSAPLDDDQTTAALADLKRWHGWAATLTGWERPAWRPDAPCPACEARALRVHLARKTATCVACGEAWTADTIGILADYVAGAVSHAA